MRVSEHKIEYLRYCLAERGNCPDTVTKKKDCLDKIIRTSEDPPISEINQFTILDLKQKFIDQGLSDSRKASLISTLKDFLKYLKEFVELDGIYDYEKITIPKVRSKPAQYWTENQIDEFINDLPEETLKDKRFKALCTLLASSGARISEALGFPRNINLESCEAEVRGKGNRYRKIYWDDRAEHYLRIYLDARPKWDKSKFLFGTINRSEKYSGKWDKGDVNRTFRKISKKIGKRVHCHLFRSSFCSNATHKGMPLATVSKLMGHCGSESIRTTARYYYCPMPDEDVKRVYQRFTRRFTIEARGNIDK